MPSLCVSIQNDKNFHKCLILVGLSVNLTLNRVANLLTEVVSGAITFPLI